ncbi:polysaccharide biosynthesis C-terminal domain-containing protein [Halorussus limi]|uniref:Polysaccharide biosynthesis C-terminal domain-containing protein n=1 Tax=Halorussus limi TaxID=2938695 RepID=A0A8U0HUA4_9EURY|nr:polysaccharide biosynthesis C-terminal domain-containing protein [Halorussus limi]UPV74286.1 polysaccharide biosynthesis C-terminal domain-containing protein [Halorussus limi]
MSDASNVSLGGETVKATLAKFTMAMTGFVGTILFARILGPTSFGGFYLLFGLVKLADRPINGWGIAAKKRFSEVSSHDRELLGSVLFAVVGWTVVVLPGTIVFSGWLRSYTGLQEAPILFAVLLLSVSLYEPLEKLVQARGLIGAATWVDALRSYLTLPLQIAFVAYGFGAAGMAYGLSGASLLVVPVLLHYIGVSPALPTRATVQNVGEFAKYSIPSNFFGTVYSRFDLLLLGLMLTPAAAGMYEVAAKLTLPAIFVATTAASGLMSRVSDLHSRGENVEPDISNTLAFASILSIPIFFGALAIPKALIVTFYGGEYAEAASLLIGLSLYRLVRTQSAPLTQAVNGLDMPDTNMRLSVATLAVNVVLGVALVYLLGAIGVVIATIVAESIRYVALSVLVKRHLPDLTLFPRTLLEQFGMGAVMFLAVTAVHRVVAVQRWFDLAILLAVGAGVYGLGLLAISGQLRHTIASVLRGSRIESAIPGRFLNW